MKLILTRGARDIRSEVSPEGDGYVVTIDGRPMRVAGSFGRSMRVRIDGRPVEAAIRKEGLEIIVELRGRAYAFRPRDARAPVLSRRNADADSTRGEIHAPMPGLIVEILVKEGDPVEAGQPIIIVEAMKMQNALVAPIRGRLSSVAIAPGAAVETGQRLATIRPDEV